MLCHPGTACKDEPCCRKIKLSCVCGLRVDEHICGAKSVRPRPRYQAPPCLPSCERLADGGARSSSAAPQGEPVQYLDDLVQLAMQHRRYVQTLEDKFGSAVGGPVVLPPC